jgi:hypothetical protein
MMNVHRNGPTMSNVNPKRRRTIKPLLSLFKTVRVIVKCSSLAPLASPALPAGH